MEIAASATTRGPSSPSDVPTSGGSGAAVSDPALPETPLPDAAPEAALPVSATSGAAPADSPHPPAADPVGTAGSPAGTSVPVARQPFSPVPTVDTHEQNARREENGQVVWRVQCGDLIGRERCMTVYVDDDEVVLVGPPGEAARLTRTQLGRLTAALGDAAGLAER